MNRKFSRKGKDKYWNEQKLVLGEDENTSTLINIDHEDDRNVVELLQNLWINNLRYIILKRSKFYFIHKCS